MDSKADHCLWFLTRAGSWVIVVIVLIGLLESFRHLRGFIYPVDEARDVYLEAERAEAVSEHLERFAYASRDHVVS